MVAPELMIHSVLWVSPSVNSVGDGGSAECATNISTLESGDVVTFADSFGVPEFPRQPLGHFGFFPSDPLLLPNIV